MIKIAAVLAVIGALATAPASTAIDECSISERVVLENHTDVPVTHTIVRGSHEGLVVVSPGQSVTVDIVRCD